MKETNLYTKIFRITLIIASVTAIAFRPLAPISIGIILGLVIIKGEPLELKNKKKGATTKTYIIAVFITALLYLPITLPLFDISSSYMQTLSSGMNTLAYCSQLFSIAYLYDSVLYTIVERVY